MKQGYGKRFDNVLKRLGWNQTVAAEKLAVSRPFINALVNEKKPLSRNLVIKLYQDHGVSINYLEEGQGDLFDSNSGLTSGVTSGNNKITSIHSWNKNSLESYDKDQLIEIILECQVRIAETEKEKENLKDELLEVYKQVNALLKRG